MGKCHKGRGAGAHGHQTFFKRCFRRVWASLMVLGSAEILARLQTGEGEGV